MMAADRTGRVGYVLRKFPVLSETFILNELLALEEYGAPLHVISLERPNDPRFHDGLPKLKARVAYLPGLGDLRRYVRIHWRLARSKSVGRRYRRTLFYALTRVKDRPFLRFVQAGFVANEVRRLKLRHLHVHFAHYPTTVALLASKMTGVPFSFTAHATDIFKHEIDKKALARKVSAARFVVTVSEFNRDYLRSLSSAPASKIVLVRNGIDLARFSPNGLPPGSPFGLLCVARLVEKKGLPVLIEACRILRDQGLSFRCEIIGKGRLRSQLESLIADASLNDRVKLLGPKTQLEVLERYQAAHAYVLPAIVGSDGNREGLPVSIVEALACGLPVVTTPVTGIPEAVRDGQNGIVVPPSDPQALAGALAAIIRDRARYDQLRANARPSVVESYDLGRTSATLLRLFEEARA